MNGWIFMGRPVNLCSNKYLRKKTYMDGMGKTEFLHLPTIELFRSWSLTTLRKQNDGHDSLTLPSQSPLINRYSLEPKIHIWMTCLMNPLTNIGPGLGRVVLTPSGKKKGVWNKALRETTGFLNAVYKVLFLKTKLMKDPWQKGIFT